MKAQDQILEIYNGFEHQSFLSPFLCEQRITQFALALVCLLSASSRLSGVKSATYDEST